MANQVRPKRNLFNDLWKNSQRKTYTTLTATIILVVLLAVLALRPTIIKVGEIQSEVKEKQAQKKDLDDKLKILTELDQKYRDFEEAVGYLDESIPEKVDTAGLTANLSEMVKNNGMLLKSIQFKIEASPRVTEEQTTTTLPLEFTRISMEIHGTKEGLAKIVKEIENYPRPMNITDISFGKLNLGSSSKSSSTKSSSSSSAGAKNEVLINIEILTIQKQGASSNLNNKD